MAESFPEAKYLQDLAQQRYPSLSADDAYLALHREILFKYPAEAAKFLGTDGVELAVALANRDPRAVIYIYRLYEKFTEHFQPVPVNLTAVAGPVPAHCAEGIRESLASTVTPDPSNPIIEDVDAEIVGDSLKGQNLKNVPADFIDKYVPQAGPSSVSGDSLVDRINYSECWKAALGAIEVAQRHQAIKALNVIAEHLGDRNCITVSGAGGSDGFARPVYDLINKKVNDIDQEDRKNHRFFVYHDATNWHPAFNRLTREHPLPSEFVNKPGHDLDLMCLFMREVRQKLVTTDPQCGKTILFHLLIPSWSKLRIEEPLHFPEDLFPLRIEGLKHGGKNQVELNLPAAPSGLLGDVENVLDPQNWNKIATGTSLGVMMPTVGWGVNGAFLALGLGAGAVTGLGMLATVPIWWGCGGWAMKKTAPAIGNTIYDSLREEAPRVLGSSERLQATELWR